MSATSNPVFSEPHGQTAQQLHQAALRKRKRRNIGWAVAFVFAAIYFLTKLAVWPTQVPLVIIAAVEYESPIPPNAWTVDDANALRASNPAGQQVDEPDVGVANAQIFRELLANSVHELQLGGPDPLSRNVLIHISCHGAVNRSNQPCLLPPGADSLNDETWLPVAELLQTIVGRLKHAGPLTLKRRVIVVLDANRIDTEPRLGIIVNTFTDGLEQVVENLRVPNDVELFVLNSTGRHQCGRAGDKWHGSLFGHYVSRGLAGESDRDNDATITLQELFDFVRGKVSEEAATGPGAPQTPVLFSKSDDASFAITTYSPRLRASIVQSLKMQRGAPVDTVDREQIRDLWRKRDAASSWLRRNRPLALAELEQQLIRLEDLAAAGTGYQTHAEQLHKRLHGLLDRYQRAPSNDVSYRAVSDDEPSTRQWSRLIKSYLDLPSDSDEQRAVREMSLRAQEWSERASSRDGARVHYWGGDQLAKADALRRTAGDGLFIGSAESLGTAKQCYQQLLDDSSASSYRRVVLLREDIENALAQRDQMSAELPQILVQLGREFADDAVSPAARSEMFDKTLAMLAELRQQSQLFAVTAHTASLTSDSTAGPVAKMRELFARFDKLRRAFVACHANSDEQTNGERRDDTIPGHVASVLATALPTADERASLHELRDRIRARVGNRSSNSQGGARDRASPEEAFARASALSRAVHAILNHIDDSREQPWKVGQRIRDRIRELLGCAPDVSSIDTSTTNPASFEWLWRTPFDELDRSTRTATCLIGGWTIWSRRGDAAPEPAVELARFDDAQWRIKCARRALDDLWGDPPTEDYSEHPVTSIPYFARRAEAFVSKIDPPAPASAAVATQAAELNLSSEQRRRAVRQGPSWDGMQPVFVADGHSPVRHVVTLQPPEPIPQGEMAFFVMGSGGDASITIPLQDNRQRTVRRRAVPADQRFESEHWLANPNSSTGRESSAGNVLSVNADPRDVLTANLLYRGHLWTRPVPTLRGGGVSHYSRRSAPPAQVEVNGESGEDLWVVVILDCSNSMSFPQVGPKRWNRALSALGDILKHLSEIRASKVRVGITAFGHRSRRMEEVDPLDGTKRFVSSRKDIEPELDVEALIPLSAGATPNAERVKQIMSRVDQLNPYGQSPLHYAIQQALISFDHAGIPPASQRAIVVLTDGLDSQHENQPFASPVSVQKLRRAMDELKGKGQPVALNIVWFELEDEKLAQRREELARLEELATESEGHCYHVERADELPQWLLDGLGGRFLVRSSATSATRAPPLVRFGDVYRVPPSPENANHVIVVPGANPIELPVRLLGGESLRLLNDPGRRQLLLPPLNDEDIRDRVTGIRDPRSADVYEVAAHMPRRDGDCVDFTISLRNENSTKFTQRPVAVWGEITPWQGAHEQTDQRYVFLDADFVWGTTHPKLRFSAGNWPRNADRATLRIWLQMTDDAPEHALREVSPSDPNFAVADGREFHWRREVRGDQSVFVLRVVEEHSRVADFPASKLSVFPPPDWTSRRFDSRQALAVHEFHFLDSPNSAAPRWRLSTTTRADAFNNALVVGRDANGDVRPLIVTVPRRW